MKMKEKIIHDVHAGKSIKRVSVVLNHVNIPRYSVTYVINFTKIQEVPGKGLNIQGTLLERNK